MLIRTRIIIERELGAEMPKLMWSYLHTHTPDDRTLDSNSHSPRVLRFPFLETKRNSGRRPITAGAISLRNV